MNIKIKALLRTVGLVAIAGSSALVLQLAVTYLTKEQLGIIGVVVLFSGAIYTLYSICLAQLRYEESVKRIAENKSVDK